MTDIEHCPFHPTLVLVEKTNGVFSDLCCPEGDWIHYTNSVSGADAYLYCDIANKIEIYYSNRRATCDIYIMKEEHHCRYHNTIVLDKPISSMEYFIDFCKTKRYMTLVLFA
jgi:hypothetical protein